MLQAAEECFNPIEEEGGIIIEKEKVYEFVKIKNVYEGTSSAPSLYETDREKLSELIFSKICKGWKMYASFHTHPSFSATPSDLDLTKLFQSFKYNIIYSVKNDMFSYSEWLGEKIYSVYLPKKTIQILINK